MRTLLFPPAFFATWFFCQQLGVSNFTTTATLLVMGVSQIVSTVTEIIRGE